MSHAGYVNFRKPEVEALARGLLNGLNPTPTRVEALLRELQTRREEIHVDRPTSVDHATEHPAAEPSDDAQREEVQSAIRQYTDFDEARRQRIMAMPLGALRKGSRIDSLTAAAEILLAELDDHQRDRVIEIARENSWPPWVVVLGSVARSADLQELQAGEFKPDWLNDSGKRETAGLHQPKCQMCGVEIPKARTGQQFCCSRHGSEQDQHSEGCALAHIKKDASTGAWVDTR